MLPALVRKEFPSVCDIRVRVVSGMERDKSHLLSGRLFQSLVHASLSEACSTVSIMSCRNIFLSRPRQTDVVLSAGLTDMSCTPGAICLASQEARAPPKM